MRDNVILWKSFDFASDILKLHESLKQDRYYEIGSQLFRSGTSIGANVRESQRAESAKDFIHKLSIARKETNETEYWLELLIHNSIISESKGEELLKRCQELNKILSSIILTTKSKRT